MTVSDDVDTLASAVRIEHAALTPAMQSSPEAVLVRYIAALIDGASARPSDVASLSKEFRAANDALREAVLRAGKRGDSVDALAAKRAARRKSASANPGRAAKRQQ
jgi:hypothetical protein